MNKQMKTKLEKLEADAMAAEVDAEAALRAFNAYEGTFEGANALEANSLVVLEKAVYVSRKAVHTAWAKFYDYASYAAKAARDAYDAALSKENNDD